MGKDLTLKLHDSGKGFMLNKQEAMPRILSEAITLLLFTNDPSFRVFDGDSMYTVLSKTTSSSIDYIQLQLAALSGVLHDQLYNNYPDITDCEIIAELIDESSLEVSINITVGDQTITEVIYKESIEG